MDPRDYLRLLRRRWLTIALLALLGVLAAAAATLAQARQYTATTQLFVSAQGETSSSDASSAYNGNLFSQARVKSYATIATNPWVASTVVKDLGLPESAETLSKKVTTSVPLDSVLLNISVVDPSPATAQRISDRLGRNLAQLVNEIEVPVGGAISPVRVSVVQPASLPTVPSSPRPVLNLTIGLLLGLFVGVAVAVLRDALDASVRTPQEVESLVAAPMVGAVGFDRGARSRPLIVHDAPRSTRAEAFRQLRTNLRFVAIEQPLRSVVVTSSVPGEGKTTTACNLAISLAQTGMHVILLDGDLRRPRLASYMGLEGAVGLTDVLLGEVELSDAMQPWGNHPLEVLTSGPLPPNPSELLGSAGMDALLRVLEGRADLVVVDACPLLPVTDSAVLAAMTTGALIVVRAAHTRREQVRRATETLKATGAHVLGAVMNMAPTAGPDGEAYGYGAGYRADYDQAARRVADQNGAGVLTNHLAPAAVRTSGSRSSN